MEDYLAVGMGRSRLSTVFLAVNVEFFQFPELVALFVFDNNRAGKVDFNGRRPVESATLASLPTWQGITV